MTKPYPKGRGRKPKPRRSASVHTECSKKRSVLKDRLRDVMSEVAELQATVRILLSSNQEMGNYLQQLLTRAGIDTDPFGTMLTLGDDPTPRQAETPGPSGTLGSFVGDKEP